MRLVCAYCRAVIRDDPGSRVVDQSHGMCASCSEHFARLWRGMSLSDYLESLPDPVIVVTGDGRVLGANEKLATTLRREKGELRCGMTTGQAFACVRSRLPEGCGGTVHCRDCAIRRAVTQVHRTGKAVRSAKAFMMTDGGRVEMTISAQPEGPLVRVTVEQLETHAAEDAVA